MKQLDVDYLLRAVSMVSTDFFWDLGRRGDSPLVFLLLRLSLLTRFFLHFALIFAV